MQIGPIRFSAKDLTITDADGSIKQLSPAQGGLLLMLVNERGRVVSRAMLLGAMQQIGANVRQLDQELRSLGELMGPEWQQLLEVVGDQGYLLHSGLRPKSKLFDRPTPLPSRHYMALMGLILLALSLVSMFVPRWMSLALCDGLTLPEEERLSVRQLIAESESIGDSSGKLLWPAQALHKGEALLSLYQPPCD